MKKITNTQLLAALCICGGLMTSQLRPSQAIAEHNFPMLIKPAPMPVLDQSSRAAAETELANLFSQLTAQSVMVVDGPSGAILVEKNAHALRYPASTTKMLTALVAREAYALDQILTVGEEATIEGTTMGLQLGEQITVRDLLHGLLLSSGNDAAVLLANQYPTGGYQAFVDRMNQKATELHVSDSFFSNPSGLDAEDQQATAAELLILAREVLKDSLLREIVGTRRYTAADVTGEIQHPLQTSNQLLGVEPGVIGVKTGTTPLGGEILIIALQRNNHELLIATMGSQDRYQDTQLLVAWVEKHYRWQEVKIPVQSSQLPEGTKQ